MNYSMIKDPKVFMKKLATYTFTFPDTMPTAENTGWYSIIAKTE